LNGGTFGVSGNHVSSSDVGIYAGEVQLFGSVASPGTWTIQNNIVGNSTSTGVSAGEGGYGEGIQLDGTTNTVDLYGNTIEVTPQADILLTGVQNANIGGTVAGQGNTAVGSNGAGLVLGGPSTECGAMGIGSANCNYGTPGMPGTESPGWSSNTNTIVDNAFGIAHVAGNAAGVVVEGAFAPTFMGLTPDPNAAYGNTFGGNSWTNNLLANIADFSGNAYAPPLNTPSDGFTLPNTDTYGVGSADNCEPSPGGSPSANALFPAAATVSGVTVNTSTPDVATAGSGAFSGVTTGALVTDAPPTGSGFLGGSSTVAAGDNGSTISAIVTAGTLDVASSSRFAAPGEVVVATTSPAGSATLAFTGTGAGTLTGITLVEGNPAATVSTGNGVVQGTYVSSVTNSGATLNMTGAGDTGGNTSTDTLHFYNTWAC
jgi:hypothetical protein